jgi:hypothetical protein
MIWVVAVIVVVIMAIIAMITGRIHSIIIKYNIVAGLNPALSPFTEHIANGFKDPALSPFTEHIANGFKDPALSPFTIYILLRRFVLPFFKTPLYNDH